MTSHPFYGTVTAINTNCFRTEDDEKSYQGVESNVPRPPLQVGVERVVHQRLLPPGQLDRPPLGRPSRALRPQRPHRRGVRVDGRPRAGDARGLPAQRRHFGGVLAGRLEISINLGIRYISPCSHSWGC